MKPLSQIISGVEVIDCTVTGDPVIEGMSQHSAKINENYIFFVSSEHAEEYIKEATERGATVLIGEKIYPDASCVVVKAQRFEKRFESRFM